MSLTLEAHDEYWGGRPPIKTHPLRRGSGGGEPRQRPAVRPVPVRLRHPAGPDRRHREERGVRGAGRHHHQPPPDRVRQEPRRSSPIRWCAAPSPTRSTARRSSTACGPGRTARAGRACSGNSTATCSTPTGRCRTTIPSWRSDLLKQANYKGDPIPYRLLNNYYTNQVATAQVLVEMWRRSASTSRSRRRRTGPQIMERGRPRARARLVELARRSTIRSPRSSPSTGRNGQQQQIGEWTNAEMNTLSRVPGDRDRPAARKAAFRRMLEICRARGSGLYGAAPERDLHRQARSRSVEGVAGLRDGFPRRQFRGLRSVIAAAGHASRPHASTSTRRAGRCDGIDLAFAAAARRSASSASPARGKSVTWLAALGLLPRHARAIARLACGSTAARSSARRPPTLDRVRGGRVAMIFQDPASA